MKNFLNTDSFTVNSLKFTQIDKTIGLDFETRYHPLMCALTTTITIDIPTVIENANMKCINKSAKGQSIAWYCAIRLQNLTFNNDYCLNISLILHDQKTFDNSNRQELVSIGSTTYRLKEYNYTWIGDPNFVKLTSNLTQVNEFGKIYTIKWVEPFCINQLSSEFSIESIISKKSSITANDSTTSSAVVQQNETAMNFSCTRNPKKPAKHELLVIVMSAVIPSDVSRNIDSKDDLPKVTFTLNFLQKNNNVSCGSQPFEFPDICSKYVIELKTANHSLGEWQFHQYISPNSST